MSTNRRPRRPAAAAPTLLLPLDAGPSSATTIRRSAVFAARLRERGVLPVVAMTPRIPAARADDRCYSSDPFGNRIELVAANDRGFTVRDAGD